MPGYHSRLLVIDLNVQQHDIQPIQPERFHKYIGGSSLAARLFLEARGTHIEPLAPESPLLIMTGPPAGTTFSVSSRFVTCARSPLTHIWGESASGGTFGAELKKAGLDGIPITGCAEKPVVIFIDDAVVDIHLAEVLWIFEAQIIGDNGGHRCAAHLGAVTCEKGWFQPILGSLRAYEDHPHRLLVH